MRKLLNLKHLAPLGLALVLPLIASAATVTGILSDIRGVLNTVIGLLFAVVTLYFIYGVIVYISAGGDDTKLKSGKQHMLWGIIGMAVIAGAWGIVTILMNFFGVTGGTGGVIIPTFPSNP